MNAFPRSLSPQSSLAPNDKKINMVIGRKPTDIWKALRRFANENAMQAARILDSEGGLSFGDLRIQTGLSANILNHTLTEMRNADLVVYIDGSYHITKFCETLLDSLDHLRIEIDKVPEDEIFSPAGRKVDKKNESPPKLTPKALIL